VSFVPNAGNVFVDPAKLTYLLATDQGKAMFFARFGFDPTQPQELAAALQWHVSNHHYDSIYYTPHGTKYVVKCSAPSPDKRDPCILSVWIVDSGQTIPRLVTAYANP
jgi:hypothetical protein